MRKAEPHREVPEWAGRAALSLAGLAGGPYGIVAGFLIGSMVDEARADSRLRRYFRDPAAPAPRESVPGLAAAAALATRGSWEGEGGRARRAALFGRLAEKRGLGGADRLLAELEKAELVDPALMARRLSLEGSARARALLADWCYANLRLGKLGLDHAREDFARRGLADAGLGREESLAARRKHFPAYLDPWELLGLEPGAPRPEIRKAWRRLSKLHHPDAGRPARGSGAGEAAEGDDDEAAAFRAAAEAFDFLESRGLA